MSPLWRAKVCLNFEASGKASPPSVTGLPPGAMPLIDAVFSHCTIEPSLFRRKMHAMGESSCLLALLSLRQEGTKRHRRVGAGYGHEKRRGGPDVSSLGGTRAQSQRAISDIGAIRNVSSMIQTSRKQEA